MAAVNNVPQLVDKKGDDIMESVISYETAKATWTDLVHILEGPSDTKENRIMDLKLEYQTFWAKPIESLSQTYTRYKTLPPMTLPMTYLWKDFEENYDDDVNERFSEEYLRDLDIEFHERALLENSKHLLKTQLNQADPKIQKDYKAEYKKMKAKLALLEANPSTSQTPKTFQPKNKGLVAETFDWDEEEVSDDEEVTQVKVLMALADDELTVGKNHARNGEWIDITMRKVNILLSMDEDADWQNYLKYINIDLKFVEEQRLNLLSKYNKIVFELNKCRDELLVLKQAKLDAVTFQIQNTKLTKLNHALQEQLKEEKKINEKWLTSSKKVSQCISEQIPHQKKKVLGGELFTESSSKMNENENLFVPASMVPKSQAVNESLKPTGTLITPESSKASEAESPIPLPPLKNLQGASPSLEVMPLTFQPYSPKKRSGLGTMKHKKPKTQDSLNKSVSGTVTVSETEPTTPSVPTEVKDIEQESKINELTKLVKMLIDEKILKAKPKPFPPCIHCGFNDHRPDDCRNYPKCRICGSYDHFTLGHNRVIHIRRGVLAESSQSSESLIGVKEPIWYMDSGCSRSMTCVKSYLHKYVEQLGSKNFSSPYTPEQNGVAKSKNRTLIEVAKTMLNGSVISKHFWTEAVRITCYTQNKSIIIKKHDKTPFETFRERIPDISYFHDILVSQKLLESLTQEDNKLRRLIMWHLMRVWKPSDSDISYYVIPHGRSLSELTQENHVPKVIAPNEPDIPLTKDTKEPKRVSEALKHPGWVDAMQEELNQLYRNKEEGIDYDETFAPVARMESIGIFLAFATYMNFKVYQIDVKSAFLNGKPKEEVYVKQPPGFESGEFLDYVCKLDKVLYGLKQAPKACSSVKIPMVPPTSLGPDLAGKPVNETSYREMIGSLMYLTATKPDIQFSTVLESHFNPDLSNESFEEKEEFFCLSKLGGKPVCWKCLETASQWPISSAKAEYVALLGGCASITMDENSLS
ncbi:retrovirus-related pol polyprotein from transposon TNT 1-94 [Tanacetum coccineum]